MATRYTAFGQDLWRTAVGAFNTLVSTGLPAVNIAALDGLDTKPCWQALAGAFHAFLLGDSLPDEDAGRPPALGGQKGLELSMKLCDARMWQSACVSQQQVCSIMQQGMLCRIAV